MFLLQPHLKTVWSDSDTRIITIEFKAAGLLSAKGAHPPMLNNDS